jgi:hypothetical protein
VCSVKNGTIQPNAFTSLPYQRCCPFVEIFERWGRKNGGSSSVRGCKRRGGGANVSFAIFDAINDETNSHYGHFNGPSTSTI